MRFAWALLLTVGVLGSTLPLAPTHTSSVQPTLTDWRIEPVAYFGGSAPAPLAIDSLGRPNLMYCPPGKSWYAVRNGTGWQREFLTATPFGGVCGELALGPGDIPQVMTPISTGSGMPLYGVKRNGTWTFEPTDVGSVEAVDSLGRPHSAYLVQTGPNRVTMEHVWRDTAWRSEEIESFTTTVTIYSRWVSFVLDTSDQPRVLYYEDARGDVRYAFKEATGWHVEVIEHIGALSISGREGSIAFDEGGRPHGAYTVRTGPKTAEVRYASRGAAGWTIEIASPAPPALGGGGSSPSLAMSFGVPVLAYLFVEQIDPSLIIYKQGLEFATRLPTGWSREPILSGFWNNTIPRGQVPQFPALQVDSCGNAHVVFYQAWWEGLDGSRSGVYYATKGGPCELRSVSLRLEPRTLNLKSHGQWVTALIAVGNASASDVNVASLSLNGVPAARVEVVNNTTVLAKFDRAAFQRTVYVGERVEVILSGRWGDGTPLHATDVIRVIDPGSGKGRAP